MASTPSALGTLERLPRELRDMVYEYYEFPVSNKRPKDKHQIYQSLALLRTSREVSEEAIYVLYRGARLVLSYDLDLFSRKTWSRNALNPFIEAYVTRFSTRLGLTQKHRLFKKQVLKSSERCSNVPHHRWQSVTVNLIPPDLLRCGTAVLCWRAVIAIVNMLGRNPPTRLKIKARGHWNKKGKIQKSLDNPAVTLPENDLQLLLAPFGCLSEASPSCTITLKAPRSSLKILEDMPELRCSRSTDQRHLMVLSQPCNLETNQPAVQTGILCSLYQAQNYDLSIDRILDSLPGIIAAKIREHRWMTWDQTDEKQIISVANRSCEPLRTTLFKELVERWAVWRAMNPQTRETDLFQWRGEMPVPPDKSTNVEQRLQAKKKNPVDRLWARHSGCPVRNDWRWDRFKYDGLFYRQRILVTLSGVCGDPDHTKQSRKLPIRPRSDVLYYHDPPRKPRQRPRRTLLDPAFYHPFSDSEATLF